MSARLFITLLISCFCLISSAPKACAGEPFDHSLWDEFIKTHVNEEGAIDYQALQKDPRLLREYLQKVKDISFVDFNFGNWPREESIALWINVFNAGVVDVILQHYPVENIQKIPAVWNDQSIFVAQRRTSLNIIRAHNLLLTYRDEKIHTALACGGKSCPRLFHEAFTGPKLEGQLYLAARKFVNDPKFVDVTPGNKKIQLSRLLKWYGGDFKLDFGHIDNNERKFTDTENAVLSFIGHYVDDTDKLIFLEERNYKIKYMPFDWSVNEWVKPGAQAPSSN